ncbi:hypothetical protein FGO68_gene327 [Halteria grandinella]|uniref:Enkurin domain-containing protein n=1 Tax=Halteria grandinella TaxID=5974 RepID=A0A8J8NCN4_HALGN|nr:hypothetical protein FGO68_gene327 [Halteria grandinella]
MHGSAAHVAFGRTSELPSERAYTVDDDKENVHTNIQLQCAVPETPAILKHKSFGKVPTYIEKFKVEMQMTKEKKDEDRAKARMPPGTRLMTEDERIHTLEELQRQKCEISTLLFSIPLSCKTEALKLRKRDLEIKLVEIDRAVTTFSRKIVYIKDDGKELAPNTIPLEVAYQKPPMAGLRVKRPETAGRK